MHPLILSTVILSALPQAPRPPQAPLAADPPKKCKQCSLQCDCGCQSGERCRCAADAPDADGWRWRLGADGYWYQWRYVTTTQAHPLHLSAVAPLSYVQAPSFVGGCAGGG